MGAERSSFTRARISERLSRPTPTASSSTTPDLDDASIDSSDAALEGDRAGHLRQLVTQLLGLVGLESRNRAGSSGPRVHHQLVEAEAPIERALAGLDVLDAVERNQGANEPQRASREIEIVGADFVAPAPVAQRGYGDCKCERERCADKE